MPTTEATEHQQDARSYPHGLSCFGCYILRRCNYCARGGTPDKVAGGRCTNGRCPSCCATHCQHAKAEWRCAECKGTGWRRGTTPAHQDEQHVCQRCSGTGSSTP